MKTSKKDESAVRDEADILRTVYGRNAAEKIAREWNVAPTTAKGWLRGQFPARRRLELVHRIDARLDWALEEQAAIRRRLGEICETHRALFGGRAEPPRGGADTTGPGSGSRRNRPPDGG
jgi:hypothetical protein